MGYTSMGLWHTDCLAAVLSQRSVPLNCVVGQGLILWLNYSSCIIEEKLWQN